MRTGCCLWKQPPGTHRINCWRRLLNPASGTLQVLTLLNSLSAPLPVPWATYPPNILKSSAGTSGDGNVIYALVDVAGGASGSSGPSEWQPSHVYAIGSTVLDPSGHIQTATVAGVSGATPPPWNDTGGASPDGTVKWQDTGVTALSITLRYEVATGKLTLLGATSYLRVMDK